MLPGRAGAKNCDRKRFHTHHAQTRILWSLPGLPGEVVQAHRIVLASRYCGDNSSAIMITVLIGFLFASFIASSFAASEPDEILLWPEGAPGSEGKPSKDIVLVARSGERSIYGV